MSRLKLHNPDEPRLRVRCEPPNNNPEPYFAIYVVRYVHGDQDSIMDSEQIGGRFDNEQVALRFAKRIASDPVLRASLCTVNKPDAVLLNNEKGAHVVPPLPVLVVATESEKKERRVGWRSMVANMFRRLLGY